MGEVAEPDVVARLRYISGGDAELPAEMAVWLLARLVAERDEALAAVHLRTAAKAFIVLIRDRGMGRFMPDELPLLNAMAAALVEAETRPDRPSGCTSDPYNCPRDDLGDCECEPPQRKPLAITLLEHADEILAGDDGTAVCWHEYTDDEALRSDCARCCVELARAYVAEFGLRVAPLGVGGDEEAEDVP